MIKMKCNSDIYVQWESKIHTDKAFKIFMRLMPWKINMLITVKA